MPINEPKISIVITSYNQKGFLREALESVIGQTLKPFEILICDDASSDGSTELIASYEERYSGLVKGLLQEKNLGISRNRSYGLENAKGEFVSWLDGDDRYKPLKLEIESRALMKDPDVKWAYSQVDLIDEKGRKFGVRYTDPPHGYILDEVVTMLGRAPRNPLVEYEALKKVGFFNPDMTLYEDFDLLLRLSKHYKAVYCPQSLMEYRVHQGGVHKASKNEHARNFRMLLNNFRETISGFPGERKTALEGKLADSINVLIEKGPKAGGRTSMFVTLLNRLRKFIYNFM